MPATEKTATYEGVCWTGLNALPALYDSHCMYPK